MTAARNLRICVEGCNDLPLGGVGDRMPDVYVVVELVAAPGSDEAGAVLFPVLFRAETERVDDTRCPIWGQTFATPAVDLQSTRLRLTVRSRRHRVSGRSQHDAVRESVTTAFAAEYTVPQTDAARHRKRRAVQC